MWPFGLKPIGQNGLRVAASRLKEDLFLTVMGADSSDGLFFASAGAVPSAGLVLGGTGADFSPAPRKIGAVSINTKMKAKILFIVFRLPWSRRWRPVEIAGR